MVPARPEVSPPPSTARTTRPWARSSRATAADAGQRDRPGLGRSSDAPARERRRDEARAIYDEISDSASRSTPWKPSAAWPSTASPRGSPSAAGRPRPPGGGRALRVDEGNACSASRWPTRRTGAARGHLDVARARSPRCRAVGDALPNYAWMPSDLRGAELGGRRGRRRPRGRPPTTALDHDTGAAIISLEALVQARSDRRRR